MVLIQLAIQKGAKMSKLRFKKGHTASENHWDKVSTSPLTYASTISGIIHSRNSVLNASILKFGSISLNRLTTRATSFSENIPLQVSVIQSVVFLTPEMRTLSDSS